MLEEERGEEMGTGYAVNEAGGKARRGHMQAGQRFKSRCTQSSLSIQMPQVW